MQIKVPEITTLDIAFGNIKHLPKDEDIPEEFWNSSNKWNKFVSSWFFNGVKKEAVEKLIPKEGVEKYKALNALQAILGSFEPQHERKEAGSAYLMSQWFKDLP